MKYRLLAAATAALFAWPVAASEPVAVPAEELYATV